MHHLDVPFGQQRLLALVDPDAVRRAQSGEARRSREVIHVRLARRGPPDDATSSPIPTRACGRGRSAGRTARRPPRAARASTTRRTAVRRPRAAGRWRRRSIARDREALVDRSARLFRSRCGTSASKSIMHLPTSPGDRFRRAPRTRHRCRGPSPSSGRLSCRAQ